MPNGAACPETNAHNRRDRRGGRIDRCTPGAGADLDFACNLAHSVLASAPAYAVREDQLPRNVAKLVTVNPDRPRRFEPLTLEEAKALMAAARQHRLHAPF